VVGVGLALALGISLLLYFEEFQPRVPITRLAAAHAKLLENQYTIED